MTTDIRPTAKFRVPLRGATNPGSTSATTPGAFANAPDIDACSEAIITDSTAPLRTVPIY